MAKWMISKFYFSLKFSVFFLFLIFLLLGVSCNKNNPIVVGFVADLSTRNSELGIQGRNGIQMAADEINNSGGIKGRPIKLLIRDHQSDPEVCYESVQQIIDLEAHIIIGPLLSGMASTVIESAKDKNILIISPTVSTDLLTGIDDMFLRIVDPASKQGEFLALQISTLQKVLFVIDANNQAYGNAVFKGYIKEFEKKNAQKVSAIYFRERAEFISVADKIKENSPDALVFAASGIDTAGIIQIYSKKNPLPQLFGSSWVKVSEVHKYGGKKVEGMIIVDTFKNEMPLPKEIEFNETFEHLFGKKANIASLSSYEALHLFALAVKENRNLDSKALKSSILEMEQIEGVSGSYCIDEFGDGVRNLSLYKIENGEYLQILPNQ